MARRQTFSQRLASLMAKAKLTGYRLAKESGVSEQAIGHYLHGDREPGLQQLIKLAGALGVSLSAFENVNERASAVV